MHAPVANRPHPVHAFLVPWASWVLPGWEWEHRPGVETFGINGTRGADCGERRVHLFIYALPFHCAKTGSGHTEHAMMRYVDM